MDTASLTDPVEELYDARIRGATVIGTAAGSRVHLHGGCWVAPAGSDPPRLMVAFPKEFEGADIVRASGVFAVGLTAAESPGALDALFAGKPPISDATRDLFLRTPNGAVVPSSSVAYFDLKLHLALDLGDFLLAVGDVTGGSLLNPGFRNLTVNEIIAGADPRGEKEALLPFRGFDYDLSRLGTAPGGPLDAEGFMELYARREWGVFFVGVARDGRTHHHLGSWVMQTSHAPPRMAAVFRRSCEAAVWVEEGAPFALTLASADRTDTVRAPGIPGELPGRADELQDLGSGLVAPRSGIASFVCRPESVHDLGDGLLAVATVEDYAWIRKDAPNLTQAALGGLAPPGQQA